MLSVLCFAAAPLAVVMALVTAVAALGARLLLVKHHTGQQRETGEEREAAPQDAAPHWFIKKEEVADDHLKQRQLSESAREGRRRGACWLLPRVTVTEAEGSHSSSL